MHIFFSGIGGVAIGPLARMARDAGFTVSGSDKVATRYTDSVVQDGIPVIIGQGEDQIEELHASQPIDWFVYTSSLPSNHPELLFAQKHKIKTSKRDEFINHLIKEKGLSMLAVAGTHGKSNTTGMLVWAFQQLKVPTSYLVGTNISFGANGRYEADSRYFIYEADEFDRNFLAYRPFASIITSVDYDHPDTYPTVEDYKQAFRDFARLAETTTLWRQSAEYLSLTTGPYEILDEQAEASRTADIKLLGEYTRRNATLVLHVLMKLFPQQREDHLIGILNQYPGTERRLEQLKPGLYTDYAHHPVEIAATLQALSELNKPIVAVYQPHQNIRQHLVADQYQDCFARARQVYWLPTYLSREYQNWPVLQPQDLIVRLSNPAIAQPAAMDQGLWQTLDTHIENGAVVVLMSAGDLDQWAREQLQTAN